MNDSMIPCEKMMNTNTSIINWIDEKDLEQCQFIRKKVLNLCRGLQSMNAWIGSFEIPDDYTFSCGAILRLEEVNEQGVIKKIKGSWSSRKCELDKMKTHKRHSVVLVNEVSRRLNELTVLNNFETIHQTIESLILGNFDQINAEIKEEKERGKKIKAEAAEKKVRLFNNKELSKRTSSSYILKVKHSALKSELADKEKALNIALLEIGYLKEKVASKELNIDNHLSKICNFVERLDANELISSTSPKPIIGSNIVDNPAKSSNTADDLKDVVYKPK